MDILSVVLIGFLVGAVAKVIVPGRDRQGWLATMVVGIGGALAVGLCARELGWFEEGQTTGLLVSMIAAILAVVGFRLVTRPKVRVR